MELRKEKGQRNTATGPCTKDAFHKTNDMDMEDIHLQTMISMQAVLRMG